jgi:hypothetical protein
MRRLLSLQASLLLLLLFSPQQPAKARTGSTPFGGAPRSVPGTIEIEHFDDGGQGVGYHDTTPGSHGQNYNSPAPHLVPTYRQPTDVDIYESSGYGGGYLVLGTAGDWMNYTVNVAASGYYTLEAQVAWGGSVGGYFHVEVDDADITGPLQIPDTGWSLQAVSKQGVFLPAGRHALRVVFDTNAANGHAGDIDYLRFTSEAGSLDGGALAPGEQAAADPPSPANVPAVFSRTVGTDVWRGNVGGLRNVGQGSISVGGISGTVSKAYLFWHGVTASADPFPVSHMTFNGFLIHGIPLGTSGDNGWDYNVSQAYRADVTHLVAFNPNRTFLLGNFGSGHLNPNGASLIILYNDNNPANDWDVTILNGNDSNRASPYDGDGWGAFFGQVFKYGNQRVSLDVIVADGQAYADAPLFINGSIVATAGNHFQGASVFSANNGPQNNGNLWDMVEYEVGHLLGPGHNAFSFTHGAPLFPNYRDLTSLVAVIYYARIDQQKVSITSPRAAGDLSNTTQNALPGADVQLRANLYPEGLTGGAYSWSFTGPWELPAGATNSASLAVRWNQPGTYTARVTYTRSGVALTSAMTVNVVLPTLTGYGGVQGRQLVVDTYPYCSELDYMGDMFRLGCPPNVEPLGISFTATAEAPSSYISEPSLSGVKMVQAVSGFRKELVNGSVRCATRRASQADVNSGWQIDLSDPLPDRVRRFSEGRNLSVEFEDYPGNGLEGRTEETSAEAVEVDDRFETYLIYFAGHDPARPVYQIPLGKMIWNWGGLVVYDYGVYKPGSDEVEWRILSHYASPGPRTGVPTNTAAPYQGRGRVQDNRPAQCPGGPPLSSNPIDGSQFFVKRLYQDVLRRTPDLPGWRSWTTAIAGCAFDMTCRSGKRILVARGFFESPENIGGNPLLANPGTDTYNREYVRLCYVAFLGRQPSGGEDQGWVDYLNGTGDYDTLVGGFINSIEYRSRFGPP